MPAFVRHNEQTAHLEEEEPGMKARAVIEVSAVFAAIKRKPTRNESGIIAGEFLLFAISNLTQRAPLDNPISGLIYYLLFVGLGEELLFRGYIQSRLNEAWGRPFQFYGVPWAWG